MSNIDLSGISVKKTDNGLSFMKDKNQLTVNLEGLQI